ncbi:dna mismatch repair [Trichoderma arundinaceum]|uniref:Dna mismatch repair n=1 Tax=Trichoderma arundinaceum TaxID=490622 RepID=A0A395NCW2_TRIAR|nr:dna mismatch repair [Trichoderma arundinaceum]
MRPTFRALASYLEPGTPTGLTGLWTHKTPRSTLLYLYSTTLNRLQSIPETSLYRQSVEATTKHRMNLVEKLVPPGYEEWAAKAKELMRKNPHQFEAASDRIDGSGARTFKFGNRIFVVGNEHQPGDIRSEEWNGESELGRNDHIIEPAEQTFNDEKLEWEDEPQLTAEQIRELEQQLGAGLIEEVIEVAEGELQLVETMEKAQVFYIHDCTMYLNVRFKNQGLDSIEVQDNGSGISPANYSSVALKHYTSKLSSYSDIASLQTFGFRGEALASLCALSILTVTTCLEEDVPKGSRLTFQQSGKLESTNVVAAQRGTMVTVENLFHNLPVRRRELDRNIKREWHKVIALLNQYACIQTNVKFSVSQQPTKGKRIFLFSTKGNPSTRDNIINIFGAKTLAALIPLDLQLEIQPSSNRSDVRNGENLASSSHNVRIIGHVSKPAHGEGRQTPDRQMFFVNGRPCSLPQLAKTFNEVYRSYNNSQSPFIFADVQLDTTLYDVNVSPDKRSILLHDQNNLLDTLRASLSQLFDAHEDRISIAASAESMKLQSSHSNFTKKGQVSQISNKSTSKPYNLAVFGPNNGSAESDSTVDGKESEQDDKIPPLSRSARTRSQGNARDESRLDGNTEPMTKRDTTPSQGVGESENHLLNAVLMKPLPLQEGSSAASSPSRILRRVQNSRDPNSAILKQGSDSTSIAVPGVRSMNVGSEGLSDLIIPRREMSNFTSTADAKGKSLETERLSSNSPKPDQKKEQLHSSGADESDSEAAIQNPLNMPENGESMLSDTFSKDSLSDTEPLAKESGSQRIKSRVKLVDSGSPTTTSTAGDLAAEPKNQSSKYAKRKDATAYFIQYLHVEGEKLRLLRSVHAPHHNALPNYSTHKTSSVERIDASDAESKLPLIIAKGDFSKMRVIGQFNLGFIIAVKPDGRASVGDEGKHDELFIIDQHASDEKYNYERLQNTTEIQSQRLVHPMRLQLTALEEEIILENATALNANGFKVNTDTTGRFSVGSRCQLAALPLSREVTFKLEDLEELISLLSDESAESSYIPRPSKVQKMFAMRACRSSIMIGKAMTRSQMHSLVNHMGELDKPWNCPHGRPTIRHLSRLRTWDEVGWKRDIHIDSITSWQDYMGETS